MGKSYLKLDFQCYSELNTKMLDMGVNSHFKIGSRLLADNYERS